MTLEINGNAVTASPTEFKVTIMDLDSADSSFRTADGTLSRDRIAVKRQLDITWGILNSTEISSILTAMQDEFFTVKYPDPLIGGDVTKTFYVGNRSSPIAIDKGDYVLWKGLTVMLTEQ